MQEAFVKALKKAGGEYEGDMLPINTSDFSATLIKARAYKPNVLLNNMGGLAQIDCMKQFVQFGMDKEMAPRRRPVRAGERLAVPPAAQTGWWDMEWWWDQPACRTWRSSSPNSARRGARPRPRAIGSATWRCIR